MGENLTPGCSEFRILEENLQLLQSKFEALETSVKADYERLTRRILVLESILLKEFGIVQSLFKPFI